MPVRDDEVRLSRFLRARRLVLMKTLALAIGISGGCGGDAASPSTPPVATLVLAGAPTAAMRVGETAQLIATALSTSGSVINGAAVRWTSSAGTVADVGSSGLVTARSAGRATVTASSGTGSITEEILVVAPLTISASGGTVGLPDGSLSLTVAPSNFTGTTTLLVGPAAANLADDKVVPGTLFQIAPAAGSGGFISSATLALRYDPARLPSGVTAGGLQLYLRTGGGWTAVRGSASDLSKGMVAGVYQGMGTYAVRFTPVSRVVLTGTQADGALYVGQTGSLAVAALAASGDTLANRAATWSSSAPTIATVDAQGRVAGIRAGSVTVTATTEGISASTPVQVLARPTPTWGGATDWSTFRGNNRRTGYVDATLDPVVFTRRWDVTLAATGMMNEPATGDGNVYVSSDGYFGSQALWALDATTGAVRWTRAFGAIHSVNGPATGNGRVYVSTGGHQDSFLWSFAAADGAVQFRAAYGNQWSRWQAPAVTPTLVFLGGGYFGGMSAFDALNGTVRWQRSLPQEDLWTPAADGGKVYAFGFEVTSRGLLALDGLTGSTTVHAPNLGLPNSGTPVLGGNNMAFAIRNQRLFAVDLSRNVVAWDLPGRYDGVPAVDDSLVYAVINGQVEARARADGALRWTWVAPAGAAATGSVILTRNLLFVRLNPVNFFSGGGRVVALDLSARKLVWSHDADGDIALGNGLLLIGSRTTAKVTAIAVR